ncbi:MAG: DMT family transporter [Rhodobiaceae bacterium]|nr:DMT family transporter [Rhodobiaceae bacterium]
MTAVDMSPVSPIRPTAAYGLGFGLAAVAMWAAYLSFARAGVTAGLKPQDFILMRFGVAGLIMLPWLARHGMRTLGGIGWARGAALAAAAGPLFIALGVGGYVFAPLAHGAVLQPTAVTLGTMAAAWLLFGERPPRERALGVAIILTGLILIAAGKGGAAGAGAWKGDILFVAAGLSWAAFTILLRRWRVGAMTATAAVAVISALVVIPAFATFGTFARIAGLSWPMLVTQVIVQGVLSGVVAVIAYGKAVELLGAARAALFPALVPAAALIVGLPVTGEVPSLTEAIGAAAATVGLAVAMGAIRMPAGRRPSAPE